VYSNWLILVQPSSKQNTVLLPTFEEIEKADGTRYVDNESITEKKIIVLQAK
jgi:hypothetical protein